MGFRETAAGVAGEVMLFLTSVFLIAAVAAMVVALEARSEEGVKESVAIGAAFVVAAAALYAASITTTVRKKGALSTSSWRPAHALDSFVALPSAKRFLPKN